MKTTKKYGKKIDLALSLWVKLARAYSTLSKKSIDDIKQFGLTEPQFGILECLGHLGPLTMKELGEKRLVSGGNITFVVDNLEKGGFVIRKYSKEDRRTIIIHLTEQGEKLFRNIFIQHAERITELVSVLNQKEQEQLSSLLKKLGMGIVNLK